MVLGRPRSSRCQQKEERAPLSFLLGRIPYHSPIFFGWKQRWVLESSAVVAFWCCLASFHWYRWGQVSSSPMSCLPFLCRCLGHPRASQMALDTYVRQVESAAGKCPPWHNVAADALRERIEAIWADGLAGLLFITFQNISATVEEGGWQRSHETLCWGRGKGQMWQTGSTWWLWCLRIQIRSRLCCADAVVELMLILCLKAPVHHHKTQPRVQAAPFFTVLGWRASAGVTAIALWDSWQHKVVLLGLC